MDSLKFFNFKCKLPNLTHMLKLNICFLYKLKASLYLCYYINNKDYFLKVSTYLDTKSSDKFSSSSFSS